ncbi:uncharacterized protein LOC128735298 [Sabethes cyaneus]|uniref:uncharacterized protein LOC128735298 n=1 Tax=Sabethes cyaneus TaxID=53552 RepID=UPI00237E98CD|nr:uncharacterized protein LOC128735298 [Sabethes cyaneus]
MKVARRKADVLESNRLHNPSAQLAKNDELDKAMVHSAEARYRFPLDSILAKAIPCQRSQQLQWKGRRQDAIHQLWRYKANGNAPKVRTTRNCGATFFNRRKNKFHLHDSQFKNEPDVRMQEMKKEEGTRIEEVPVGPDRVRQTWVRTKGGVARRSAVKLTLFDVRMDGGPEQGDCNGSRAGQQEKRRELRLKKFWRTTTKPPTSSEDSGGCESPTKLGRKAFQQPNNLNSPHRHPPACSLPLLQVWPSQDSPRGEADGQSFVFPLAVDDHQQNGGMLQTSLHHQAAVASSSSTNDLRRNSLFVDQLQAGDSGIDSVQASPSPVAMPCHPLVVSNAISPSASPTIGSPTQSVDHNRRPSTSLLHPDHARIFALRQPSSPDQTSLEDNTEFNGAAGNHLCTASSSTTSSLTSVAVATLGQHPQRSSDPWLRPEGDKDNLEVDRQRRASTMTARLSLFDALDLEYALLRAAARGSVGPYSLSESLHKLTFTQSLAFPALARGLAAKRRTSTEENTTRPLNPNESGLNTFAKVVTACVLVMVSFLVFLVVYKYVRT